MSNQPSNTRHGTTAMMLVLTVGLMTVSQVHGLKIGMQPVDSDARDTNDGTKKTCSSFGWKSRKPDERQPRVIDAYAYNGESLIASVRYEELKNYINGTAILITEANFHGEIKALMEPPLIPILHQEILPATKFQECGDTNSQGWNYCALSMTKNSIATSVEHFKLHDDDWVIFSDPDEIPDREVVRLLLECDVPVGSGRENDHIRLRSGKKSHGHHMYTFGCGFEKSNWIDETCLSNCKGVVVVRAGTMRQHGLRTFQAQVKPWCVESGPYATCGKHLNYVKLPESMWHLSSFGGPDMLANKMKDNSDAYAPTETDLKHVARECRDLDEERKHPDMKLQKREIDFKYPHVPHSVSDAPERYSIFFNWDQEASNATSSKLMQNGDQGASQTDEYTFYNPVMLAELGKESELAKKLRGDANAALTHGPWSVTDKTGVPPSGDKHDYFDGSKYKDQSHMIDNFAKDEVFDRARFSYMVRNTTILSLAYKVFGDPAYCKKAALNIEKFYTGPDGVTPHMKYTHYDARTKLKHFGVIGWKDHYYLLDAAKMVKGCFQDGEYDKLKLWTSDLMKWLLKSDFGKLERGSRNNHGSWYDVLVLSLMRFNHYSEDTLKTFQDSIVTRMAEQVDKSGMLPLEMTRPNCLHYQMFGLQGLVTLARVGRVSQWPGVSQHLQLALKKNVPELDPSWKKCEDKPLSPIQGDMTRFGSILMMSATQDDRLGLQGNVFEQACSLNPLFHDDAGIAPYWQFALNTLT